MLSQIFKYRVDKQMLFDFLDQTAVAKGEKKYIFDNTSYKKAVYLELIDPFINDLKSYYHTSKLFYLEKKKII